MINGSKKNSVYLMPFIIIFLNLYFPPCLSSQSIFRNDNIIRNPFVYKCTELPAPVNFSGPSNMGYLKPSVTDINTPEEAYFPVLIVFVQFADDPAPDCIWWPKGSAPAFIDQLIARDKKYPVKGNWWDTYSEDNEIISDFWMEQSRGHFHVIGRAVSVVLD